MHLSAGLKDNETGSGLEALRLNCMMGTSFDVPNSYILK